MALNIDEERVERKVRLLSELTGKSLAGAVELAVDAELELRKRCTRRAESFSDRIRVIQDRAAMRPVLDPRTPDEILGYGETGLPA